MLVSLHVFSVPVVVFEPPSDSQLDVVFGQTAHRDSLSLEFVQNDSWVQLETQIFALPLRPFNKSVDEPTVRLAGLSRVKFAQPVNKEHIRMPPSRSCKAGSPDAVTGRLKAVVISSGRAGRQVASKDRRPV
jgi:hypothetical protein